MIETIASLIAIVTFLFGVIGYLLKKIKLLKINRTVLIDTVDDLNNRVCKLEEKINK